MQQFKNVLCVLGGEADQAALERSVTLAENNQAQLTVATVTEIVPEHASLPGGGQVPGGVQARLTDARAQWLDTLVKPYRSRVEISIRVLTGTPFLEMIREVLRNDHDLLIKCPESPDWLNRLFSGDDMNLLRKCPCPVWMVKPKSGQSYRRVLAAVDVDDGYPSTELETRRSLNLLLLEIAASLAISEAAELHVVHAWQASSEKALRHNAFLRQPDEEVNAYVEQVRRHQAEQLDELMRITEEKLGKDTMEYLKPLQHLLKGTAREQIPALASKLQVDCIVMGTVARTGIRGFVMGNTAETLLEQIDSSVLAIKPAGFITPVEMGSQ